MDGFYEVTLDKTYDKFYFKERGNATDFLWESYIEDWPEASEDEQISSREELIIQGLISGEGRINYYEFED